MSLTPDGGLQHAVTVVAAGTRQYAWQIDAITGATVSSRAVARLLNDSAVHTLAAIRRSLADFDPAPAERRDG